jgi:ribosomal protein L37AE/L43A
MNDEILKKLERQLDRRSFLRGSSLAAAALVGVAAASPLIAFAQEQGQKKGSKSDKKDDKKEEKEEKKQEKKDDKELKKDEAEKGPNGDQSGQSGTDRDKEKEKDKDAKIDEQGREYRECPQCGSNMYRQGRTWTCENCGYSYVE